MENQEIPYTVIARAEKRLKSMGFKQKIRYQAIRMIQDTTEVVEALGGRIDWSEPQSMARAHR
jgi:hypothetical protein